MQYLSRRDLLKMSGAAVAVAILPSFATAQRSARPALAAYPDILREPDSIVAFTDDQMLSLARQGQRWNSGPVAVELTPRRIGATTELAVAIEAPGVALQRVRLRWRAPMPEATRILGDQWERSYGDLEWRGLIPERVLPWYFLAAGMRAAQAYGVRTGAAAFCFWQADASGISLWLDVRNGGAGVSLGSRRLDAAVIRSRRGAAGETPFQMARSFCHDMCAAPQLPAAPVYGGNNWYYAYGRSSREDILRDSDLMAELAPSLPNRPFMVIDDGWQPNRTAGPWERGNDSFPDMPHLAQEMRKRGVKPGIWMRPLYTMAQVADSWRQQQRRTGSAARPNANLPLDPTVPEVLDLVRQDVRRLAGWGFEIIKHDYSTFDLFGRWGSTMNADITDSGWHFADRGKTNAEIVLLFYRAIREAAGSSLVIGCNTLNHLSAGVFELQRTGDDTSGQDFNRTRRMGVNTIAFRGPQHGAFFAVDADCVPITPQVPWALGSQWLDFVGRSGTPLFVSADPRAIGAEQKQAIKAAFDNAARQQPLCEPLDWSETTVPRRWRLQGKTVEYNWIGPDGATPFPR
ncbi:MAG: twin-arginine translocation signal domain-containing protein [Acidobacteriota bacterium]